jgi:fructose-bisphosphate aldolase class II
MPVVSTLDILREARAGKYGVGAYNVFSLDQAASIIRLSDTMKAPVLITVPAVLEQYVSFSDLGAVVREVAGRASIPVGIHLSHGKDIATLKRCIDAGFTSVMIDGSVLPFGENVKLTSEGVQLCHKNGVACEGELGAVGSTTGEVKSVMTDPEEARRYVEATNVDIFAVSIGNAHGFYKGVPKLDFTRFSQIKDALSHKNDLFFTLHGGTGISPDDLKKLIAQGCPKICIYTEMCGVGKEKAFDYLARHPEYGGTVDVPELFKAVLGGFLEVVKEDIEVFGSANKVSKTSQSLSAGSISAGTIEEIVRKVMQGLK